MTSPNYENGFVRDPVTQAVLVKVDSAAVTLDASDIEIGAVEIKDATGSGRAPVDSTYGLGVDVTRQSGQAAAAAAAPAVLYVVGGFDGTGVRSLKTDSAGILKVDVAGCDVTVPVSGPLTDAQLRASAVPVSGTFYQATQPVSLASAPTTAVTGPLTDTQLRATAVPVSGTVTASGPLTDTQLRATAVPVSGPLTDTQIRATALPVSGTVTASGPLTDTQLRASTVPVSGTVTASGPVTDTQIRATPLPVSGTVTANAGSGPFPVNDNSGSLTVDAPVGTPLFARLSDGTAALTTTSSRLSVDASGPSFASKSIGASGSLGTTTAAIFAEKAVWVVPANYTFRPVVARCGVTTAGSRTLIAAGARLATFNPGSNTFAADQSVAPPDFYDRLFYRVNTTHSATADTITATYTNQSGTASQSTAGNVIPSAAGGGQWWEFTLAAGDVGVRAVTAVSDSAAPTSVVDEIWGLRTLLDDLGPASTLTTVSFAEIAASVIAAETVFVLMMGAATTAQQRHASVMGVLVPV